MKRILSALLILAPLSSYADDRDSETFPHKSGPAEVQFILGLGDAIGTGTLWGYDAYKRVDSNNPKNVYKVWMAKIEEQKLSIQSAQEKLSEARNSLTDVEKKTRIEQLETRIADSKSGVAAMKDELIRVRNATAISESEKAARIAKFEGEIGSARREILNITKESGFTTRSPAWSAVRIIGGTLFLADLAGRVYVWNAMDRNPTLSPLGAYSAKKVGDAWQIVKNEFADESKTEAKDEKSAAKH